MRVVKSLALFVATLGAVTAAPAFAQENRAEQQAEPPALVLAISVDQLSADLFAQYRRHFTGGFARLLEGAVFPSGYQSHAATETCPGHSTLLTGVRPARSGIVANWWFDPAIAREDKRIYCAEDESDPRSNSRDPVVSAVHLKVPTLGDMLKKANRSSRNVAVSGKDRAAVMMGGHDIDAAYWWNDAGFTTFKGRSPSASVQSLNASVAEKIEQGVNALPVPDWCAPRDRTVMAGGHAIGSNSFALPAGQAGYFGRSPHLDTATADLAISLIEELQLGQDDAPDVLSVSFSATDYVGHAFGHQGVEMCVQLAQLDATIGRVFEALDSRGINFVAVLSADHGGIDAPERLQQQGYPNAQRMDEELSTGTLAEQLTAQTGIVAPNGPVLLRGLGIGDIYFSPGLETAQKQLLAQTAVALLKAHPQVADAFIGEELAKDDPVITGSPADWTLRQRVRASYKQGVSGDILVLLRRGVVPLKPMPGLVSTHGSPWDYDRRVPILFWRKGLPGLEQPAPVETVDIAPTLAALLHLEVDSADFDGRCLDIDGGATDICSR